MAHDLGTTGNKATLHSSDGRTLALVTWPYDTTYRQRGVVEQNPEDWWDSVCGATRELLDRTGAAAAAIEGIAFSGRQTHPSVDHLGRHQEPRSVRAAQRGSGR